MLTAALVKGAQSRARAYKLSDARGLYLYVAPTGLRSWRMKFRFDRKEKLLTFGTWPELSLADARARCDSARAQIRAGEDPTAVRARELAGDGAEQTFETVARAWHEHKRDDWSGQHAADVMDSLERDVFPAIGALPVDDIGSPAVLKLLRAVEARGCLETARRIRQRLSDIFALAISEGWASKDPAAVTKKGLRSLGCQQEHPAIVDPAELVQLLDAVDRLPAAPIAKLASRFLALTAVRMAAARFATWSEFEDLDGGSPVWRVPAARMKLKKDKKAKASMAHLVPLSPAAMAVLRAARAEIGSHADSAALVFPGRVDGRPIGEGAIGALYHAAGYKGRHVPHGWRASFSTILNERHPADRAAIDLALAHSPKNDEGKTDKVEGAYNRMKRLERRRWLFDRWSEFLGAHRAD